MKHYTLLILLFWLSYSAPAQEGNQRADSIVIICVENGNGDKITDIDLSPFHFYLPSNIYYNNLDCIEMIWTLWDKFVQLPESLFFLDKDILGVNLEDMQLLQDHLIGNRSLNIPPQLIAADCTGDQRISGADIVHIEKLILGKSSDLYWNLLDKNVLEDSLIVRRADITLNPLDPTNFFDVISVKTADLNFSQFTGEIYDGELRLKVEDQILNRGEYYSIPLILQNNTLLRSFQIEFSQNELLIDQFTYSHYNSPSSFTAPEDVFDDKMVLLYFSDQAQLLMPEDTFMTLNFRAMGNGVLSEMLTFHSDVNNLATMSIGQLPKEIVFDWTDKIINSNVHEIELEKISLFPNPASDYLEIHGISSFMNYQICDLLGKVCGAGNLQDDTRLDLLNLNNGMYILTIKNSFGASKSFKFFVAK